MIKFPSRQAYDEFMADPDYKPWKEFRGSITTPKNVLLLEGYDVSHFALTAIIDITATFLALVVAVHKHAGHSRTTAC